MELTFQMKINKWSISEIEEMLPYELEIYSTMQGEYVKERNEEMERSMKQ